MGRQSTETSGAVKLLRVIDTTVTDPTEYVTTGGTPGINYGLG